MVMDIIQASSSCSSDIHIHPSDQYNFSRISSGIHISSSILSLKPRIPSGSKLISTAPPPTTTTWAIRGNSTSYSVGTKDINCDQSLAIKKRASEISPYLKGTSIFLVGINSSYKSSLGKIMADILRYCYFDSDILVEEAAGGKSAATSFIERDEEGYLASEIEVLKQLSSMGRLVVCAGNGAVKSATNLHGISIWIDVPLDFVSREIIEDRIQFSASDIPLCKSSSEVQAQVATLYNSGRSGYSTADVTISLQKVAFQLGYDELDAVTIEDLCLEVLKEMEKLVRVKKMVEEAARPF
ncbi:hypothetical protein OROMI_027636 [Orobanche minor]